MKETKEIEKYRCAPSFAIRGARQYRIKKNLGQIYDESALTRDIYNELRGFEKLVRNAFYVDKSIDAICCIRSIHFIVHNTYIFKTYRYLGHTR